MRLYKARPALTLQPEVDFHFIHSGKTGHTALWVIFALFVAGFLGTGLLSLRVEKRARLFHL
jgi:hypothetical protein